VVYQNLKGKCPKCDKLISSVTASPAKQQSTLKGRQYDGVFYTCPFCAAILGTGIDPTAVAYDAVDEIVRRLAAAKPGTE
jgi:hypothetical protein